MLTVPQVIDDLLAQTAQMELDAKAATDRVDALTVELQQAQDAKTAAVNAANNQIESTTSIVRKWMATGEVPAPATPAPPANGTADGSSSSSASSDSSLS